MTSPDLSAVPLPPLPKEDYRDNYVDYWDEDSVKDYARLAVAEALRRFFDSYTGQLDPAKAFSELRIAEAKLAEALRAEAAERDEARGMTIAVILSYDPERTIGEIRAKGKEFADELAEAKRRVEELDFWMRQQSTQLIQTRDERDAAQRERDELRLINATLIRAGALELTTKENADASR